MKVYVGCCGFPVSRERYFAKFKAVELQDTFYNPPEQEKLIRLRSKAPEDFKFSMKVWQAITHPPNLRTWKKSKVHIPRDLWSRYGYLKATEENFQAWKLIDKGAQALGAEVVVVQLPPSFKYKEENLKNMESFFSSLNKPAYTVGLEVRGDWKEHHAELKEIIDNFDFLIHITDPFRWRPVTLKETAYFRLHGIGGREVNYKYKYTEKDLQQLGEFISSLPTSTKNVFVFFNNISMLGDALKFKNTLKNLRLI